MASANNTNATLGLPLIPLSPIAQSFIICKNAINHASEKLTEAKKVRPHLGVDVLRGFLETVKLERHRLDTLTRKMQSVEAATALFWDSDALARQIAVINCQLYSNVLLDKRSLSQLDAEGTKLLHLVDFHHYLTHSFAHQLIYWAELTKPESPLASAVIPPVHASKDSLVTHLIRVAYLLLHAYRDFSGFAAIMKALTAPEVKRLKKLWQPCSSRTKDMFRDLSLIISPKNNYTAYYTSLKTNVQHRSGSGGMMIAVPWIQPHLLSIRSIVTAYTAGDDHDQHTGDIVLSAPGAHKLNIELSLLELCQHNSTIDANANDYEELPKTNTKRSSMANKAIHIEGLRAAVIPVSNLNHLAPGDQLTHHWLVSRVYLRKDQLINESIEVEPLKYGESITCDKDEFEEAMSQQKSRPASVISRPASVVSRNQQPQQQQREEEDFGQELVDIVRPTVISGASSVDNSDNSDSSDDEGEDGVQTKPIDLPLAKSIENLAVEQHEVTLHPAAEPEQQKESEISADHIEQQEEETPVVDIVKDDVVELQPKEDKVEEEKEEEKEEETPVPAVVEHIDSNKDPLLGHDVTKEEVENKPNETEQSTATNNVKSGSLSVASSSNSTTASKPKSGLSPTAPEFVPGGSNSNNGTSHHGVSNTKKPASVITMSTSADEKWLGYPMKEGEESNKDTESEKWNGYPAPNHVGGQSASEQDDEEVWKGYPGPNSNTDSPRRASSQSETSEEWKGYQATKMEADWQRESALKVQEQEWQGYALETLDEDELDSSTMMDGEFEKSRQARGRQGNEENFTRKRHA